LITPCKKAFAFAAIATVIACSGCASFGRGIERGRMAYHIGDFATAQAELRKVAQSRSPAAAAAKLDLAMTEIVTGNSAQAIKSLRELRDEFDEKSVTAPVGEIASIVADDNVRSYRPAGYEKVMIRSMLSLCSLAVEDGDAESYALQAQMMQADLARQAEERGLATATEVYQPLALAPYLRGVLRESTMHDYDDAIRAYQLVSHLEPRFSPAQSDIQRCMSGIHSPPGHGVLYVIALVGRGPVLEPVEAETTTAALQIASQIQSIASDDKLRLPNFVSVKVPKVVVPYSPASALSLDSSGVWLGATQPLVDIGSMAIRQCEAEMPWTIARAIVRRVTKEVTVSQATKAVGLNGVGRDLVNFATVNTWSLTEHADTRCWGLLPREVQVLRAELPKGTHRIGLSVVGPVGDKLGVTKFADVEIHDGRNTYMTVMASDREPFVVK
jgi:tetratricopeptide (TPR) repeat protein